MLAPLKHTIQLSKLEDPTGFTRGFTVRAASRVPVLSRGISFTWHNSPLKYCCSRLSDEETGPLGNWQGLEELGLKAAELNSLWDPLKLSPGECWPWGWVTLRLEFSSILEIYERPPQLRAFLSLVPCFVSPCHPVPLHAHTDTLRDPDTHTHMQTQTHRDTHRPRHTEANRDT